MRKDHHLNQMQGLHRVKLHISHQDLDKSGSGKSANQLEEEIKKEASHQREIGEITCKASSKHSLGGK